MSREPIYAALVAEGFDPASVSRPSTVLERRRAHEVWWQQTLRKASKPPVSRRRVSKKAAS